MSPDPGFRAQPRVRGNDWPSLAVPALGGWEPARTVSVVIPAYRAAATLPLTLAALTAQTYPAHLLEVVVVDDGSEPAVVMPSVRPGNTTVVRTTSSWGRAHACHVGAEAASGEVIHWLDADMLPEAEEVEAQMRWHHLLSYAVVLGSKTFVDTGSGLPGVDEAARHVRERSCADLFAGRWTASHDWVEEHVERTHGLTDNPTMSFLVHVGASASVGRELYLDSGGMDAELKLGEDIELGYRLAQQGAVFVPDAAARSWHLGRSTLMGQQEAVNAYNRPFVTGRVPSLRHWRTKGRSYLVPWVEVLLDTTGRTHAEVRHSVDGVLEGSVADVQVVLLGPWSALDDTRRSPLADPDQQARLVRAEYAGEPRVRFAEAATGSAFPTTYRLLLPAGWRPGPDTLRRLAREATRKDRGLVSLLMPDGEVARLERTSAFRRASRIAGDDELDGVVDEISGSWWFDGVEEGFTHVSEAARKPGQDDRPAAGPARRASRGAADPAGLDRTTTPNDRAEPAPRPRLRQRLARGLRRD